MSLYDDLQANAPKANALDSGFASQAKLDRDRGAEFAPVPLRHAPYDRAYFTTVAPMRVPGVRVEVLRDDSGADPSVLIGVFTDRNFDANGQELFVLVDNITFKTIKLLSPRQTALRAEAGEAPELSADEAYFGARCVQTCRVPLSGAEGHSIEVITQGMSVYYNVFPTELDPVEADAESPALRGRFIGLDEHGDLIGWVGDAQSGVTPIEAIVDQNEKSVYLACFPLGPHRKKARDGSKLFRIPLNTLPMENRQEDGSILSRLVLRELGETAPLGQGAFQVLRRGKVAFWWRMRVLDDARIVGSVVCLNDPLQTVAVQMHSNGAEVWRGEAINDDPQDLSFQRRRNTFEIEAEQLPEAFTLSFKVKGATLSADGLNTAAFRR